MGDRAVTASASRPVEHRRRRLEGERVAFTGRWASLSRPEALRLIARHGAAFTPQVTRETTLVVVGQARLPVGRSGRLTKNLRRAHRWRQQGAAIAIVDEYELLDRLKVHEPGPGVSRYYTAGQMACVIDVPARRLRAWVRIGLLEPSRDQDGIEWFDYRQLAAAQALCRLQATIGRRRRFRRSLRQLARLLPKQAEIFQRLVQAETNGPLLWRNEDGGLLDAGGQLHFDFDAEPAASLPFAPLREAPIDAERLFEQACQAEAAGNLEQAETVYRDLAAVGGGHRDAHFNLGNVLVAQGRYDEAIEAYRAAIELDERSAEAWNNLGVALGELQEFDEACAAFQAALRIDPRYGDAIYNLADALDLSGRGSEARRYWQAYVDLDPRSEWGRFARLRVAELTAARMT